MPDVDTLLLDLDGTLADTGPDMAAAINALRCDEGLPPLPYSEIRPCVSHGSQGLIMLGFGIGEKDPAFASLRQRFLRHYEQNLCRETRLFEGMETVLGHCEGNDVRWGIVTNKPGYLTDPLVAQLGLAERASCVVSGDSVKHRKPHPDPLLFACQLAGAVPERSVYIGDACRDVEAGNRAGMITLVATFGYLGEQDQPESWGAHGMVTSPPDIIDWLRGRA